ncbi:MAG: aspartate aminotransferase family protein [Anaerolineae bacterium]|nr:aspartate aminotransferase family protein [Anaerolineae bacterium]
MVNPVSRIMVDFKQMKEFSEHPFIIDRAEDVYLYDDHGKQYIDGMAGVFVVSVGHANATVLESISEQMHRLTFAPPLASANPPAIQLAERLCKLLPSQFTTVKFASGGSEAIEAAIKMARQYHKQTGHNDKYKVIATYGSYHGGTLGALSASGVSARRDTFEPMMAGMVHVHPPNFAQCPLKLSASQCAISCVLQFEEAIRREGPDTVACVLVEPVMNVEGLIWPPSSYFQALRAMCDRYNVLLIYDEVISGFGRTGTLFFAEQAGAWPDILCTGKGMSGGYAPLAATIINDKVAHAFWGDPEARLQFNAGHTFAGNPLACAAGLAVLDYFAQRHLLEHVAEVGPYLGSRMRALKDRFPNITDVRGLGLWWGIEFIQDNPTGRTADDIGRRIERAARERGLIVRGAPNMISVGPPLTITTEQIDDLVNRMALAIADVCGK